MVGCEKYQWEVRRSWPGGGGVWIYIYIYIIYMTRLRRAYLWTRKPTNSHSFGGLIVSYHSVQACRWSIENIVNNICPLHNTFWFLWAQGFSSGFSNWNDLLAYYGSGSRSLISVRGATLLMSMQPRMAKKILQNKPSNIYILYNNYKYFEYRAC